MTEMVSSAALPPRLLLYDGICGLCHGFVRFVLRWDRRGEIFFAPLQGGVAGECLRRHGQDAASLDSIVLLLDAGTVKERLLVRSAAVVDVLSHLAQPMPVLAWLMQRLPRSLRDAGYNAVARHRYKIFGKVGAEGDTCALPSPMNRERFL